LKGQPSLLQVLDIRAPSHVLMQSDRYSSGSSFRNFYLFTTNTLNK
jgi:hypothetical protein